MAYSTEYLAYLQSKTWAERRLAKLEQATHRCQYCGEKDNLSVHHLTYENLGNEDSKDLLVLCTSCHWVADKIRRNPKSTLLKKLLAPVANKKDRRDRKSKKKQKKIKHWYKARKDKPNG